MSVRLRDIGTRRVCTLRFGAKEFLFRLKGSFHISPILSNRILNLSQLVKNRLASFAVFLAEKLLVSAFFICDVDQETEGSLAFILADLKRIKIR